MSKKYTQEEVNALLKKQAEQDAKMAEDYKRFYCSSHRTHDELAQEIREKTLAV